MSNLWFLYVVFFIVAKATFITRKYTSILEFDNKKSNKELIGEYNSDSLIECAARCQKSCGFFGYDPQLKKCRLHKKIITPEMSNEADWRYYSHHSIPIDCKDLCEDGYTNSEVYEIYPYGSVSLAVRVYCDMETMDGGWTTIQKRINGNLSFDRNWTEYKNGFGAPEQNVWIGNDVIHQLTKGKNPSLYVSITLVNGSRLYELYDQFSVSNEADNYKLFLAGNATGSLGDSLLNTRRPYQFALSGMSFSTFDNDNDKNGNWKGGNCPVIHKGAWWFKYCHDAFLNGPWSSIDWSKPWFPTVENGTDVRGTIMMIKRH